MMPITGNKGEWSELYVLLKLIEHPILYLADDNLEIDYNAIIPVLKIKHYEERNSVPVEYDLPTKKRTDLIRKDAKGKRRFVIDKSKLKKHVKELLEQIANAPKRSRSFPITASTTYMKEIGCASIKAGSSKKADIILDITDRGQNRKDVGYSIKSMVGGASTLFNTSQHSGIVYKVNKFIGDVKEVNSITGNSKYQKRLKKIVENGGNVVFDNISSKFFENLKYIDSTFPEMIAAMIRNYYMGRGSSMRDVAQLYAKETGERIELVEFRMKQFLLNAALGMTAGKIWDGYMKAEGGYLIVKNTGELACYQAYSRDKFADYLFNNTKIDTPSGGRHKFAKLFRKGGSLYIILNFQIRFMK